MKTEEEDNQDINNHSDDNYLQIIAKLFKKEHKFETNTKLKFVYIKVPKNSLINLSHFGKHVKVYIAPVKFV